MSEHDKTNHAVEPREWPAMTPEERANIIHHGRQLKLPLRWRSPGHVLGRLKEQLEQREKRERAAPASQVLEARYEALNACIMELERIKKMPLAREEVTKDDGKDAVNSQRTAVGSIQGAKSVPVEGPLDRSELAKTSKQSGKPATPLQQADGVDGDVGNPGLDNKGGSGTANVELPGVTSKDGSARRLVKKVRQAFGRLWKSR